MGLKPWSQIKSRIYKAQQGQSRLLIRWEFSQASVQASLDADPLKDAVNASLKLMKESPEEGFTQLLDFATRGSLYSMNYVAFCYAVGRGVAKDPTEAEIWYRRTFERGSDWGALEYGECLAAKGELEEARQVYEEAWRRGFVPAAYRLVRLYLRPNLSLAQRLAWKPALEWAVDRGHPAARFLLAKYLVRAGSG